MTTTLMRIVPAKLDDGERDTPIELDGLLTLLITWVRRYVVVTDHQAVVIALWTAHTHAIDAADCTPYLQITSATKRAGKTRLLEVLEPIVARPWSTGRTSAAALVRKVDAERPTLLLDESDAAFGGEREYTEALRGILNTGYRRSGRTTLCVGQGARDFGTFSPKAIAGIGQLPGTIADRAITIHLRRRTTDEPCDRWRERDGRPQAAPLHEQLASWAKLAVEVLRDARPVLPGSLGDRQADVWEPLIAIAELAGGSWPSRARNAAIALAGSMEDTDITVELLKDVAAILGEVPPHKDIIASAVLIEKLAELEDRPWATYRKSDQPITARGLARLLDPLDIRVGQYKVEGKNARGYRRDAFGDAITRYLPSQAGQRDKPSKSGPELQNLAGTALLASPSWETQNAAEDTGSVPQPHINLGDTGPAESVVATPAPTTIVAAAPETQFAVSDTDDYQTDGASWADSRRPFTIGDCILPARLKGVFAEMVQTRTVPNLLLHGPSGTGKTTVAKALCAELGINPSIVNASEDRGIDLVRERLRPYAAPSGLYGRKFVILDEADYLPELTQAALRAFTDEVSAGCGFILTANSVDKIIPALLSRCAEKCFGFPDDRTELLPLMIARAEHILRDERVTYDPALVVEIVAAAYPDFRKVLNILQGAVVKRILVAAAVPAQSRGPW